MEQEKETKLEAIFNVLSKVDCSAFTEKKNGLTYLSWIHAYSEVKSRYASTTWGVMNWGTEGQPKLWIYDEQLGYLVQTWVNIDDEIQTMRLPVLDGANKAQKAEAYTYKGTEWVTGEGGRSKKVSVDKTVEAATMFDINTAIMRCLTKNLAMFGLGAYIYAGEDFPKDLTTSEEPKEGEAKETAKPETKTAEVKKTVPAKTTASTKKATTTKPAADNAKKGTTSDVKPAETGSAIKPSQEFSEPTPKVDDSKPVLSPEEQEGKRKAAEAFKKLSQPAVLGWLLKNKYKYTKVEDFIANESLDTIRVVYGAVTAPKK